MVVLRPAVPADRPWLTSVGMERDELPLPPGFDAAPLLAQQEAAAEAGWSAAHPDLERLVVEIDATPVGRCYLAQADDVVVLVDLVVRRDHRGRGIGGAVVREVIARADARTVRLHVAHTNPARRLYERAGFVEVARDEVRARMELRPPPE